MLRKFILFSVLIWISACAKSTRDKPDKEDFSIQTREGNLQTLFNDPNFSNDSLEHIIDRLDNDSLKIKFVFDSAYHFYKMNDSTNFHFWNDKALGLSHINKDTLRVAEAFWDLGNFYFRNNSYDKSYYNYTKAYTYYNLLEEDFLAGRMLLNLATIERNIKDYAGSEVTTIRAIEKLKPIEDRRSLYMAYNNLGIIYNELADYVKSHEYHSKALQYAGESDDNLHLASSLNNIGVVLKNSGNYEDAAVKFNKALSIDSVYQKKPALYAMLLDNLAHAKMSSKDTSNVFALFQEALAIRENLERQAGIAINKIHLSEYFLERGDTMKATNYALQAGELSKRTRNFRDFLVSMLLLAKTDPENSDFYLNQYIKTNDSLQIRERAVRNKFARIKFETDEFIAENEELTQERRWVLGGSLSSIGVVLFMTVLWRQKAKNKKLELEKEQQQANEHIYNLLLAQENKMEEGRRSEKVRISGELHDGILSTMYGIRFNLSNLISKSDPDSIEKKERLLQRLQLIEEEIRTISRDLQKETLFREIGFIKILQHLVKDREKELGFIPIIQYEQEIDWTQVSNRCKMNLYRIIQEALHNIGRYAEASVASVIFERDQDNLILSIQDNGQGMDPGKKVVGIGLKNMEFRVNDLGGKMILKSDMSGTEVNITIPKENG